MRLALLSDGRVLVSDSWNHCIRMLSADLQQVHTVAGDGGVGHRDGAAARAQLNYPMGLARLPDGRVLVTDRFNHRIRLLSADLQQMSTVAGVGTEGHRNGAAMQAAFNQPRNLAVLHDGRVLVSTRESGVRILSADFRQVHTVVPHEQGANPWGIAQLSDGRVLVGSDATAISVLEGFPSAHKPLNVGSKTPGKSKNKRALSGGASVSSEGGGASSSTPCPSPMKRGRLNAMRPGNTAETDGQQLQQKS